MDEEMSWDIDPYQGVWMAYYPGAAGGPGIPFQTELQALRHALSYGMHVKYARFGDPDWATRSEENSSVNDTTTTKGKS
jgi:hypothetical protein